MVGGADGGFAPVSCVCVNDESVSTSVVLLFTLTYVFVFLAAVDAQTLHSL